MRLTFIFCISRNLTIFTKVYPANLLISQYKHIIPARKYNIIAKLILRNVCLSAKLQNFMPRIFSLYSSTCIASIIIIIYFNLKLMERIDLVGT